MARAFLGDLVDDVEDAEAPAVGEPVVDEVKRKGGRVARLLGQKLLLRVLLFQGPPPLRLGNELAAEFGLPIPNRRFQDPMFASQVSPLRSSVMLPQYCDNLFFREPCSLHLSVLLRRTLTPSGGNTQWQVKLDRPAGVSLAPCAWLVASPSGGARSAKPSRLPRSLATGHLASRLVKFGCSLPLLNALPTFNADTCQRRFLTYPINFSR